MASTTIVPSYLSHISSPSPTGSKRSSIFVSFSTSRASYPKNPIFLSLTWVPQLGLASFSPWNGLSQKGFSISLKSLRFERRRKRKGKGVSASLFGVGAPEALVIGVVALLVFGPKGLAEIAKNLGKTLRAFQPTIRELQEVSREFKSTLEKEIGLDELQNPAQGNTLNLAALSSSPLSDAEPATSQATAMEAAGAVTTNDTKVTTPPTSTTKEDSQATASTPATATEDSQATASTPAATTTEDSQATAATPAAITKEDSQATATHLAATTGDSQVAATTLALTMKDSQPTIDPNSVQENASGTQLAQK